jgi:hypothetical protein
MLVRVAVVTVRFIEPLTEPSVAVMAVVPPPEAFAIPELDIVATEEFEEFQETPTSACVLPSLKVPVAVNCSLVPAAIVLCGADTAMDTRVAGSTFRVAVSDIAPTLPVMVVVPVAIPVAIPEESMVATPVDDEDHVTFVRSCVVPSVNVPVATN